MAWTFTLSWIQKLPRVKGSLYIFISLKFIMDKISRDLISLYLDVEFLFSL